MEFMDNLYVGELIEDPAEVFEKLKKRTPVLGIYCICISQKSKFQAEILSSRELFAEKNRYKNYKVIGISMGKPEAKELFSKIVEDYISAGDLSLLGFKKAFASEDFISV